MLTNDFSEGPKVSYLLSCSQNLYLQNPAKHPFLYAIMVGPLWESHPHTHVHNYIHPTLSVQFWELYGTATKLRTPVLSYAGINESGINEWHKWELQEVLRDRQLGKPTGGM